jgi:hypothetical protein
MHQFAMVGMLMEVRMHQQTHPLIHSSFSCQFDGAFVGCCCLCTVGVSRVSGLNYCTIVIAMWVLIGLVWWLHLP